MNSNYYFVLKVHVAIVYQQIYGLGWKFKFAFEQKLWITGDVTAQYFAWNFEHSEGLSSFFPNFDKKIIVYCIIKS